MTVVPVPTEDQASVTFPATAEFARVGRVTASGLALRLGFDVGRVESLRLAVDDAVLALSVGGTITLDATWTEDHLEIHLGNPDADIADVEALTGRLIELVPEVTVSPSSVSLVLDAGS